MRAWPVFALGLVVLFALPYVSWQLGERSAGQKLTIQAVLLEKAQSEADSLRRTRTVQYLTDTLRIDSLVYRWKVVRDTGKVTDTLWRERLVAVAETVIVEVGVARRQCLSLLGDCQARVDSVQVRNRALTVANQLLSTPKHSTWRSIERGVCAASIGGNLLQWRIRK